MSKTNFKKKRIILISTFIVFASLILVIPILRESFETYFLSMLYLSIQCFKEELIEYGIITLILQIVAWSIAIITFYYTIFNFIFPKLRGINDMGAKTIFARKIMWLDKYDPDNIYCKVKFTLFPIFKWYTMKIPKPSKKIKWVRMPSYLDISSDNINLTWDEKDRLYKLTDKPIDSINDDIEVYRKKSSNTIKHVGEYVGDAIHGDSHMMKDYYTMSLVMDENKELVPKNSLKKPPSDIEKDVEDE